MTAATLVDRYIDAAMRTVPEKQRSDLAAELRASIADQIDARTDAGEPHDAAERSVLTALGDPEKLAAGYTDRPLYLIGPKYYLSWWRLMKVLLWVVPICAVFGVSLGMTLAGEPFGAVVGSVWGITLSVVVHLFFWTTLVFVIIERAEARSGEKAQIGEWTLDDLPERQARGATFGDMITAIVGLLIGAGAILWDRFIGFVPGSDVSFFDPRLWPWWVAGLFAVMALDAAVVIVAHAIGRWTYALASVNLILNVVVTVPALWLLSEGRLINPEFWSIMPPTASDVPDIVAVIAAFVIVGIAVWDSLDGFLKARRAR